MDQLIYKNETGQEIEFSYFSPYILQKISESTPNDITTIKQSNRDGEIYASSALGIRDIKVQISMINNPGYIDVLKRNFISILNPKKKGKLIYRNDMIEKEIEVYLDEIPQLKYNQGTFGGIIDFVALDPYWTEREKTEYLALLTPKLTFPLIIPKPEGIVFGHRQSILETEVTNIGDIDSGFRVIFKAKGLVQNVEVENKLTGQKIKVIYNMQKGDVIEIINLPNKKMILINNEKAFKHLDINNSDFFDLKVGKNLLGYNAETNAVNLDVILYYKPLYLGR